MIELTYGEIAVWALGIIVITLALVAAVTLIIQSRNAAKRRERERHSIIKELDRVVFGSYYSLFSGRETNYNHPKSLMNRVKAIEEKLGITLDTPEDHMM